MKNLLFLALPAALGCATPAPAIPRKCEKYVPPPVICEDAKSLAKRYQKELADLYKELADCQAGR